MSTTRIEVSPFRSGQEALVGTFKRGLPLIANHKRPLQGAVYFAFRLELMPNVQIVS